LAAHPCTTSLAGAFNWPGRCCGMEHIAFLMSPLGWVTNPRPLSIGHSKGS